MGLFTRLLNALRQAAGLVLPVFARARDFAAAWEEAVRALNAQGLDVRDAPLFLILGRPGGGEGPLFQAAQMSFVVQQAPKRPDAPLAVWAAPDGIYVTCADASLTGRF